MSHRFAVVYEAPADFLTATELADRVLVESIDWLEEGLLEHQRTWLRSSNGNLLKWTEIANLARALGISAMGHFDGASGEADAIAARRAIRYLRLVFPDLAGILLIRDRDDQPKRRDGLEQARREAMSNGSPSVVIGLAIIERECWVISGFEPRDEREASRLEEERRALSFDPRLQSHELDAGKDNQAPRSPKRVLRALCSEDRERERACWFDTPLSTLRDRGRENGLAAFLDEVRNRLAVLIGQVE